MIDAGTLFANFETIAEVRDGVERIRSLILELAVSGCLVEQDSSEEPSKLLLKRIQADIEGLVASGSKRGKRPNLLSPPSRPLPNGWLWTCIYELGLVSPSNSARDDDEAGFVPMPLVPTDLRQANGFETRLWGEIKKGYTHVADGDIAVAKITPCFQNRKSTVFAGLPNGVGSATTELHVLRPTKGGVNPEFVLLVLKSASFIEAGTKTMTGTAGQQRVPREYFEGSPFPLPPLAEQTRIVAKVDELMALCNELEARQQVRAAVATAARGSMLSALREAQTPNDLDVAWQRTKAAWGVVTGRAEQLDDLRQSILDLAFRGRLVAQEIGEESPQAFFERVSRVKQGGQLPRGRESKGHTLDLVGNPPYSTPVGWTWVHLEDVCEKIVDCLHRTPKYVEVGYPAIRTSDLEPGRVLAEQARRVDRATYLEQTSRLVPREGDVLYSREGGRFGIAAVVPSGVDLCISQRMMHFRCAQGVVPYYFCWFLNSPLGFGQARAEVGGSASPHVNIKSIRRFVLPLPPMPEQRRIVKKINELMALCDAMEAALVAREDAGSRLSSAMVTRGEFKVGKALR